MELFPPSNRIITCHTMNNRHSKAMNTHLHSGPPVPKWVYNMADLCSMCVEKHTLSTRQRKANIYHVWPQLYY